MKTYFTYIMSVLLATAAISFAGPNKAAIEAKETAAWQAFKDKNADAFKKVVDKDFVGVYDDGLSGMKKELKDMKRWNMKSFKITDYKVFSDEKDVAVSSYTVRIEGTFDGKDASGTMNSGSVWKSENGQWLAIFHTNVAQKK